MNKRDLLIRLRSRIIDRVFKDRWQDVWFFPRYKEVKGYLGTQRIIFLSVNPSTGTFPSEADKRYYDELAKNGFANAHLTDVFKQRSKDWKELDADADTKREARRFLLAEIDIIKPRLIVLVGKKYEKLYSGMLRGVKVDTVAIDHYAFRYGSERELKRRLGREIRRVKDKYLNRGNGR